MTASPPRPIGLAIGGLLCFAAALGIGRFVYTPILPHMVDAIPLTGSEAGLIASANFAGYLAGALAAATPWLGGSRRAWLFGALAASALTTLLSGLSPLLPVIILVRFAGGVASALVMVFASSVILDRLAALGAGRLSAVLFAGVGTGIAASAALIALVGGAGWRGQWLAAGILALLALPAIAWLVPAEAEPSKRASEGSALAISRRLASLIGAYALFGFGYVITATFLVAIVRGAPDLRPLEPVIWIAFGLCAIPSVALWNATARRIGVFRAYALASVVEAIGVGASVLVPNALGAAAAALFLGGTFMGLTALGLVGARSLASGDPRRILALMTGAFGLGQILGPSIGGFLFDRTGSFTTASLIAAGALLAGAVLTVRLDAR